MSKRLMVIIGAVVVLLGLGLSTARDQAALVRFDKQLGPILQAMEVAAEAATKDRAGVDAFHARLPEWKAQVTAITPPASGYRAKLHADVLGFFKEFEAFCAKDAIKARETKLFEQIGPTLGDFHKLLAKGPETVSEGDGHDH